MIGYEFIALVVASFTLSLLIAPIYIEFMKRLNIVGIDIMKSEKTVVGDMGGTIVMFGFVSGLFVYIGYKTFVLKDSTELIYVLATISTVLIMKIVGTYDSLTSREDKKEGEGIFERLKRKGLPDFIYYLIPLIAVIPLMSVNAGVSNVVIPFIGNVELGMIYPVIVIPIVFLCCTNATNFLAGFNGLESGMGTVLHLALGIVALMRGRNITVVISLLYASSMLAFTRYHWYPARTFAGDLNYITGAVFACSTILGNMDVIAMFLFMPWIVEAFLKLRSGFKAESYGILQENGIVKPRTDKIYSLTHIVMRMGDFTEYEVTIILIALEVIVSGIVIAFVALSWL